MPYTQAMAIDFWFEFDEVFTKNPPTELIQAYAQLQDIDRPRKIWTAARRRGAYPADFQAAMHLLREPLLLLAQKHLEVIDQHFQGDPEAERRAFEDFGQGILWDDRREPTQKLHMMETGGPGNPPLGYHRWHPFIRAFVVVGAEEHRWLEVNRNVGLAWAIQSLLKPVQDKRDNPAFTEDRLQQLRATWLSRTADQLDAAFDSKPYPAVTFARVKEILDGAIAAWQANNHDREPKLTQRHGPQFACATKQQLADATGVGFRLIDPAKVGNGQGSQTNLVMALRDDDGVEGHGRMPHGGPYLPADQIDEIVHWIDAGLPD